MHLSFFDYALWIGTPLVQAAVLLAMYRRKLNQTYPWFFRYTILQVISTGVLAVVFRGTHFELYYYAYYVNLVLSIALCLGVIYEVSRVAFQQEDRSLRVLQFIWAAVIVVGFLVLGFSSPRDHSAGGLTESISIGDQAVRVFQIVLALGLTIFSGWLQISRRSFVYGVALGFGLFATVSTLIWDAARHWGVGVHMAVASRLNALAYLAAALIWLAYSLLGSARPSLSNAAQTESLEEREIRKWIERNSKDLRLSGAS